MYYAVNCGSLKTVDYLWKRGARLNAVDEFGQSALLIAIYNEDLPLIEYLLKRNANVNEIYYGRSFLSRAVLRNNYELSKLLIDYGADVNYIDSRHRTIYSYALEFASEEIIELLVEKKASLV
jgi:ankyrin repeat protein